MTKYIVLSLILLSCSFKPEGKKSKDAVDSQKESVQNISSNLDSDGDGMSDADELRAGSDPYIAEVPVFEGGLFDEVKINLELYNKQNKETQTRNLIIKENKIKLSWEEDTHRASAGSIYMVSLLKSYATAFSFKKNNFRFFDYNEGILSYSSPLFFEDGLLSISKELLKLNRSGFEINRAEATILNKFRINSKKYVSYKNPVFDIYYKSKDREGLIFIESKRIDGTYGFNEMNEIYLTFESFDQKIINEALLSGGSSFFLKLRDFVVYETDETYSSILEKVKSVCVPVTISSPESDKLEDSKYSTVYVGINPKGEKLKSILTKAFKKEILMTDSSIDQVHNLSNRQRSYGESGQNEILKWFVGFSEINDSIYTYDFKPNQGVGLAYLSDKKTDKMPIFVSRTTLTNGLISTSGALPSETRELKIKVLSQKILTPYERISHYTRSDCGGGDWDRNEVHYDQVNLDYSNDTNRLGDMLLRDGQIKISSPKGIIIQGNIGNLIKDGLLVKTQGPSGSEIDLTLSPKIAQDIIKAQTRPTVELMVTPPSYSIRQGLTYRTGANCDLMHRDHQNGNEGGRSGGINLGMGGSMGVSKSSGFGFAASVFETAYDLDIHVLSY